MKRDTPNDRHFAKTLHEYNSDELTNIKTKIMHDEKLEREWRVHALLQALCYSFNGVNITLLQNRYCGLTDEFDNIILNDSKLSEWSRYGKFY